ncbi:hypothetical protein D3C78_957280 [compost metagenome]
MLESIYRLSVDFDKSRMYPGVPEYINEKGRGMYTYLTGSASWILLTQLTEMYGVKGYYGDLHLEPKLLKSQFDHQGTASVETLFADRKLNIVYRNPQLVDYGQYQVKSVTVNGAAVTVKNEGNGVLLHRSELEQLPVGGDVELEVILG